MSVRPRLLPQLPLLLLAVAVACLAINSQSLWIDEAQTALKAIPPTLRGWWHALDYEHNSNMQLPLYMYYIWAWARLFGYSEVALRAANIPFFFLGFFAIAFFLRRHPRLRSITLLVYCLHPFVWFYLNEARPYIMQLSGALLVTGALFEALDTGDEPLSAAWWWLFPCGIFILCGSGLLGVPWAIALSIPLCFRPGFWSSMTRAGRSPLLFFGPALLLLALYFAWTIEQKIGAGYRSMNLAAIASVFYDQVGFIGLGPARADLRPSSVFATGTVSLAPLLPYVIPIALLALPLAWALFIAARQSFGLSRSRLITALCVSILPAVIIFALGYIRGVRMLGRHLTPLFPFILLAQAFAILLLWKNGRPLHRIAAALILFSLTFSSLQLRFNPRHGKDDYRSAAAVAAAALAQGKVVWWAASSDGAAYYRLPTVPTDVPGYARLIGPPPGSTTPSPDLVVISKPDLTDPDGVVIQYIAARHYRIIDTFPSFTIWSR